MANVVCLIGDPERTPLDRVTVAALERALGATGRWLTPDEACELPVDHHEPVKARRRMEATLPPVAQLAPVLIRWGDLTALLYLEGVPRSDFVAE